SFQQMAGLVVYYDTQDHAYVRISHDDEQGKSLNIIHSRYGRYDELLDSDISIEGVARCGLRVVIEREYAQFYYCTDEVTWHAIGGAIDISHMSDDHPDYVRFTGTFIGVCVQDLSGARKHADFDYFVYKELD